MRPHYLHDLLDQPHMRRAALYGLIFLLALWHGHFFLTGYRLSADDVYFTHIALQGPQTVLETARWLAEGQGRIGFLYLQPVNMFAALMSEVLIWRLVFVTLYFSTVWLIFVYAGKVLKLSIAPFAFLIFLALHPLGFEHLPPTTYPLQNTLPFLVLVSCRLAVLSYGERGGWGVLNRLLQFGAMLATEFALLLGIVMVAAEVFANHPLSLRRPLSWLRALIKDVRAWIEIIILGLVVGVYIAYRLAHPSGYEGNSLAGIGNLSALIGTTWHHINDGLVLPRFRSRFLEVPLSVWTGATLSGLAMYAAIVLALRTPLGKRVPLAAVVPFLLTSMIFVTLPVSASLKQQGWCEGTGHCAYLDSRTSILGVVLLLVVLGATVLQHSKRGRFGKMPRHLMACVTASIFVLGGLHNWHVAQDMLRYDRIWKSAHLLACMPDLHPKTPAHLYDLIDPNRLVPFHEAEAPLEFWPLYLETVRRQRDCSSTAVLQRSLAGSYLPNLRPEELQDIGGTEGAKYLGAGWSNIEEWGVWSSANKAELIIIPKGLEAGDQARLQLNAHMFLAANQSVQRLIVTQNGQTLWEGTRGSEDQSANLIFPLLPHDPAQETITLTLTLPDAHAPSSGGDTRTLGIGLKGLLLHRP
ncbi:DUF7024 domain-containing protein [Sulfitobacter sp. W074]|uniref:DUF7024 domain-containing protein n=1 Tax=Sulfitobacter sp. W074 TaxID=2867026 RepID=UPI0021A43360|nr:hypothetical protein [Sulfitobacter sp. W074]UWR39440.1 hypothetical protein K3762_18980 [Sulfitobacter sp. W074]